MIAVILRSTRIQPWILIAVAILFVPFSFKLPYLLDYPAYIQQWQTALVDPSGLVSLGTNAYGPVHYLFAFLYKINSNLPRIAFVLIWLISGFLLLRRCSMQRLPSWISWLLLFFLYCNPYFFRLYIYGQNDLAVSGLLVISILNFRANRFAASGTLFALALSYKFYPLVMLPFLSCSAMGFRSIQGFLLSLRWRYIFSVLSSLLAIYGLALIAMGSSVASPFWMLAQRPATESSIAFFTKEILGYSFLSKIGFFPALVALLLLVVVAFWRGWAPCSSANIALLTLFVFSPVFYFVYSIGFIALLFEDATARSVEGVRFQFWLPLFCYMPMMLMTFVVTATLARFPSIPLVALKGLIYAIPNLSLLILLCVSQERLLVGGKPTAS